MSYFRFLMISLGTLFLAGCEFGPNTGAGFSLPEGDAAEGRETFLAMGCNACHVVGDIEQLALGEEDIPRVTLGGPVSRVKTYGDLVTSIINPSHRISKKYLGDEVVTEDNQSRMLNYNDVMSVTELVNLVTFLETNYDIIEYRRSRYTRYKM